MRHLDLNTISAAALLNRLKPGLQHTVLDVIEEQESRHPTREAQHKPVLPAALPAQPFDSLVAWLKEYGPLMDDEIATVTAKDGRRAHRLTEKGATRLVEQLGSVIRAEIQAVYERQREIEENKQRARLERRRQ